MKEPGRASSSVPDLPRLHWYTFICGKFGVALPGAAFVGYWLNPWYFAWIAAPLAIVANIVVSLATPDTPEDIRKHLASEVHGVR